MPFNIGPLELVIVLVIALLVIGPRRLPEMGNSLGKTIREFRKASSDVTEAVSFEPDSKPAAQQAAGSSGASSTDERRPSSAAPSEEPSAAPAEADLAPSGETTPADGTSRND